MSGDVVEACSRWLGLQHGNSIGRAVFLSKRQVCHGVLLNEDLPDQKCRRLGCRRCWSRQNSAHKHSQMQRLLIWTVFVVALGTNEARRKASVTCSYLPTPTTRRAAAFRTTWSRPTDDLWRDIVQNAVAVINSTQSNRLVAVINLC